MTLPSNPTLQEVNVELGRSATQAFSMAETDSDPRILSTLAGPTGPWQISSLAGTTASAKNLGVGGTSFGHGFLMSNYGSMTPNLSTPRGGQIEYFHSADPSLDQGRTTLSVRFLPSNGQFDTFSRIRVRTGSFMGPVIRELFASQVTSYTTTGDICQWAWYASQGVNDWMAPYNGQTLYWTMFEP